MQLPGKQFQHMTSAMHQGRILLFGIDSDRAIYYCVKLPPGEAVTAYTLTPAGLYRLKQALLAKSPPFAVGARIDPLVGQNFVDRSTAPRMCTCIDDEPRGARGRTLANV